MVDISFRRTCCKTWFHRRRSKWVNWDWIWGTVWSRWLANCQRRAVLSIGWVAPFRSSSPVNTSPPPLSAKICPDSLIPAEHEKMSHSSPSCRRQLVLYTFYHHFSLFTGRANIGDSGSCGDVGELASNLGEKEKEEKRLKHKVARFECILSIDLKCQFVALLCPTGLSDLVAKFATNARGITWWPNLQQMKVAPSVAKFAFNASRAAPPRSKICVTDADCRPIWHRGQFDTADNLTPLAKTDNLTPRTIWHIPQTTIGHYA